MLGFVPQPNIRAFKKIARCPKATHKSINAKTHKCEIQPERNLLNATKPNVVVVVRRTVDAEAVGNAEVKVVVVPRTTTKNCLIA